MHEIIKGMHAVAVELGVEFHLDTAVERIQIVEGEVTALHTSKGVYESQCVVAAADYHFVEQNLIDVEYRQYDEAYWDRQILAPSSLIYYLGFNKKIKNLKHHNLFFDRDFETFGADIY